MKKIKKLQLPNQRAFIEREILGASDALFRFEAGQPVHGPSTACNDNPCEHGILLCTPTLSGSDSLLYLFNANDPGGDALGWEGLLGNQGGHAGSGAEGTLYYYFKSSAPRAYSKALTVTPGSTVRVTGYTKDVNPSTSDTFDIVFCDSSQVVGTNINVGSVVVSYTLEDDQTVASWIAFDQLEVVIPENVFSFGFHRGGASVSFDEVRVTTVGSPITGQCSITYQDGTVYVLSGSSEVSTGVFALLATSSSNAYMLPTSASDVSEVYIDFLPTDEWQFVPESNMIFFPEALSEDTQVYATYLFSA